MPAPSLRQLAKSACIKNIRSITDVGDVPYELIRPVLIKLENPEQLREIEQASPQIIGHDAEIWRRFIKRDIEDPEQKLREPKKPDGWYRLYRKLRREEEAEKLRQEEQLKASMQSLIEKAASRTSKVVDPKTVPKLPRANGMRVEKAPGVRILRRPDQSSLHFTAGSKTKMVTGTDILNKSRREAKEMSLFSARNSVLSKPTHLLSARATQLRTVPKALVEEHKRPAPYSEGERETKRTKLEEARKPTFTTPKKDQDRGRTNDKQPKRRRTPSSSSSSDSSTSPVEIFKTKKPLSIKREVVNVPRGPKIGRKASESAGEK